MTHLAMIAPQELLLILGVFLLLFGAKKLPELASALGRSVTEFKNGLRGEASGGEKDDEGSGSDPHDRQRVA